MRFEPLGPAHVAHLESLVADPQTLRFTRIPEPPPPGFAADWAARYARAATQGIGAGWAVFDDDGSFAGVGLVPEIDVEAGQAELGYITAPAARGRGVGAAILGFLTRWAFEEAGIQRAVLLIEVGNPASQGVARRCGYVLEGVARSLHLKQGRRVDTQVWSRLPGDPAPPA